MKHKFQFDKKTGTMVPMTSTAVEEIKVNEQDSVQQFQSDMQAKKPMFAEGKSIAVKTGVINTQQNQIVKMQRVDAPTPIQLINENGIPEAYLDSVTTGVMMFRELQDYDICQITDEKTGKVLAYIGGYALQINFNMTELNTIERIDQCLQGMVKLFRHKIMNQAINNKSSGD